MEKFLKSVGALNDETRIKLLRFIKENGEVCVCDIESSFNMVQSRVSRHLKILKDGGFLSVDRRGKWAYYSIKNPLGEFESDALKEVCKLDIELPKLCKGCKI